MRVLHCIHSLNPAGGGPADFVRQCAQLQSVHDLSLEVACLDKPEESWLKDFPAPVHALGPGIGYYGFSPKFYNWVHSNCQRFDAVVINGIWQFASYGTWLALRGSNVPYFVFVHGMLDPWFNERYPLKRIKKQIFWVLFEYFVLADATATLFTSELERSRAAQSFSPYEVKARVVPYGTLPPPRSTDLLRAAFHKRFPHLIGKRVLLYLGRLHSKKGLDMLLQATKLRTEGKCLNNVHLILAGPSDEAYKAFLNDLLPYPELITYMDMVSGDDKWALLAGADALILPSHQENFARVVSEALSCGTPALVSDKVNIWPDLVRSGAGMAAPDTVAGTVDLLARFEELSPGRLAEMRIKARACYSELYDLSLNFKIYLDMLRSSGR